LGLFDRAVEALPDDFRFAGFFFAGLRVLGLGFTKKRGIYSTCSEVRETQ
jgi:hypothetical protein